MVDTLTAFAKGDAARAKGAPLKVFDWDKAAKLIVKNKPSVAVAGLSTDMEWTSGIIFENKKPTEEHYTYLASVWATPVLVLNDDGLEIPCWKLQSKTNGWDASTKWPDSAREILKRGSSCGRR